MGPEVAEGACGVGADFGIGITGEEDQGGGGFELSQTPEGVKASEAVGIDLCVANEQFGLDAAALTELARESVRASFAPDAVRSRLLAEIDAYANTP